MFDKMQARYLAPRKSRALKRLELLSAPLDQEMLDRYAEMVTQREVAQVPVQSAEKDERKLAAKLDQHYRLNNPSTTDYAKKEELQQAYSDLVAKRYDRLARMKARKDRFVAFVKSVGGKVRTGATFVAKGATLVVGTVLGTAIVVPVTVVIGACKLVALAVRHIWRLLKVDLTTIRDVARLLWEVVYNVVLTPAYVWRAIYNQLTYGAEKRAAQMQVIRDFRTARTEAKDLWVEQTQPHEPEEAAQEAAVTPVEPEVAPTATPEAPEPTEAPAAAKRRKPRRVRPVNRSKPRAA
jgi:hypothetical protein